jgi:hypothetical protein
MDMADRFWGERSRYSYAWRAQLDAGARLAFGSDAPWNHNPFWGLRCHHRKKSGCHTGQRGLYPQEKLDTHRSDGGIHRGAAYLAGMEDRLGKLMPGFHADLIVLNKDIFSCSPDEIRDLRPIATMVAGDWFFSLNSQMVFAEKITCPPDSLDVLRAGWVRLSLFAQPPDGRTQSYSFPHPTGAYPQTLCSKSSLLSTTPAFIIRYFKS